MDRIAMAALMQAARVPLLPILLIGSTAIAHGQALSFKDKTITMIVGSSSGGGTDTSGRLIAPILAGHLPGNPTVIVRDVPGGQGITAMNYFVRQVAPDGLTITMASSTIADPLLYRRPQSQFDPVAFRNIGGVGRGGTVLIIRKDAEPRLFRKDSPPVIMGALGGVPRSGMLMTSWGMEYLGWNARWVLGYRGTNELELALERGEIDMTSTANLFEVQKLLDSGRFKFLAQSGAYHHDGTTPRPEFGNTPVFATLMQGKISDPIAKKAFEYWASLTSLDKWVALPPKTPEPVVQAYRAAYAATFDDPTFVERGRQISEGFEPVPHEDIDALVDTIGQTPPEALEFLNKLLRKQGIEADKK
jgi:tripartite-type tricarboxylate transporter receptor subunit TctC